MQILTLDDLIIPKYDLLLHDILDHKYIHYTLFGGRGSTKSSFISIAIILLLTRTENKDIHAIIFRKVGETMRDSVYSQMIFSISLLGMEKYFKFTVSPMEITYIPTGQKILFRGLDKKEKIKSIKAPFGYFGISWFEELDQYHGREEIRSVLQSTMRGGEGKFWNFESFNPPVSQSNWTNKDLLIERPDRLIVKSSYLDVPRDWLSETFFDEAEFLKSVNTRAYRHEYLGEATGTGGNVFENIKIQPITDAEMARFDKIYCGLDFGFFPDPTAFVACYYHTAQRTLYIFEELKRYKTGNDELAKLLEKWKRTKITADSAEPKSISALRQLGFAVYGAKKGAGSVDYGIKFLASLNEIIIDNKRCPNAANEFLSYEYERTKDGEIISGYPDRDNHFIDATRYALEDVGKGAGFAYA